MDERLEKAFRTANYMASLSSQRKLAVEEYNQSLIYYHLGSSFKVTRELICFIQVLLTAGKQSAVLLDDNQIPINVTDLNEFFNIILAIYGSSTNAYLMKYTEIKSKRKVEDLIKV